MLHTVATAMDQLISQLVAKVGLDEAQAQQVANFIREHADEIPKWLAQSGLADRLPGGLGGFLKR